MSHKNKLCHSSHACSYFYFIRNCLTILYSTAITLLLDFIELKKAFSLAFN